MKMNRSFILGTLLLMSFVVFSQEEDVEEEKSNLQVFTPSKLLNQGQWDVKWFNNLYTENKFADSNGDKQDKLRENYFTSTLEVFTGVSKNSRVNIGGIFEFRSNAVADESALSVFNFQNSSIARVGLSSFAPAIKIQPIESVGNFSFQTALHIPLIENESENGVFLDQTAWTFQNRFFYDYTFPSGNWQLFTELNTEYHFGNEESFADKTFGITPGVFLSYFPSQNTTVLGFVQHLQRFGNFTQNFTALGFGGKYQLTQVLNVEVLYSKFVRGTDNGLGQSFNLGLRALF